MRQNFDLVYTRLDNFTVVMAWSAEEYRNSLSSRPTGQNEAVEAKQEAKFHPLTNMPLLERPAVVVDRDGKIILWYVPNIMTKVRQVR